LGALFGLGLRRQDAGTAPASNAKRAAPPLRWPLLRGIAAGSLVAADGALRSGSPDRTPSARTGRITLTEVKHGPQREVLDQGPLHARQAPPKAPAGARDRREGRQAWWVRRIERVGEGV